jgi:ATP-dependent exoDNAse (exonuclease V) beta subunit
VSSGKVYREKEFFMNTSADDIQIVQGVVDLIAIEGKDAIVVDYKTGNFDNPESLAKYHAQLKLYATAVEKCYNVKVNKLAIVAVERGDVLFID